MNSYKTFPLINIGNSDSATLTLRTPNDAFILSFGEDSSYKAYYVTGDAEIGEHYRLIKEYHACWLKIYDDSGLAFQSENWWDSEENYKTLRIYRAGSRGCIIQFTK